VKRSTKIPNYLPIGIFLAVVLATILYSASFWGCAPQTTVKKEISEERSKAIEDSLRKVKEFEIAKYWSLGYEYYKNKSYLDAKRYFLKLLKMDPQLKYAKKFHYRDIFARLATCYIQENKPDSTEWAYRTGLKFFPDNAYLHASLGYILRGKGQLDEAIKHYEKAVALRPEEKDYLTILADLYVRTERFDQAIQTYNKYLKLNPSDRKIQEILAGLYRSTGREEEEIQQKEAILAQHPDDLELMLELGKIYHNRNENEKAVAMLQRLLEKDPQNTEALEYLGKAYMDLEQYNKAIMTYKKIIQIEPQNARIFCNIASAYRMKKNFRIAKNFVRKALSIDPKFGLAFITMAQIYETSAEDCINKKNGKIGFDDKLVYEKAYFEYQKAAEDPQWCNLASKRMEALKALLPTPEDRFFHKGKKTPTSDCYKWMF